MHTPGTSCSIEKIGFKLHEDHNVEKIINYLLHFLITDYNVKLVKLRRPMMKHNRGNIKLI